MYVLIAGGGKAGANVMRTLLRHGHEATIIEQKRDRFERLESEFEHQAMQGDATELYTLEKAGVKRPPDLVLALTGDDEDNLVISQLAKEKYGVQKIIARVNDPRNQPHFDLLGISPTVCATSSILGLVEHEVPEHDLVHLLELRKENLEIVEVQIDKESPSAGKTVEKLRLPEGSRLISVMRDGTAEIAVGSTELKPGDQVLAILQPGKEDELRRILLKKKVKTRTDWPRRDYVSVSARPRARSRRPRAPCLAGAAATINPTVRAGALGAHHRRLDPGGASAPLCG